MKKRFLFLVLVVLLLVGCDMDNSYTSDNQSDLPTNSAQYSNPDIRFSYPQTIIVNGTKYNIVIDLSNPLSFEPEELIGHLIHEKYLESYKELYPNLIPVVNNFVESPYTNDMIEIYSIKNEDVSHYLTIKVLGGFQLFESNEEQDEDQLTGPVISGLYIFETYEEFYKFYKIFINKNEERYIIPNFEQLNVYYFFECGGIHASIIHDKIYDYDFPCPEIIVKFDNFKIHLQDISKLNDSIYLIDKINIIQSEYSKNNMEIYADEYLVATIECNNKLSDSEIVEIFNAYMNVL